MNLADMFPKNAQLACVTGLLALGSAGPLSAESYNLQFGKVVKTCPGERRTFKVSSPEPPGTASYSIAGYVDCADLGNAYSYTIRFLNVVYIASVHPASSGSALFYQLGFALYRPSSDPDFIDWISDDAQPIDGQIQLGASDMKLTFAGSRFVIPKENAERATNMTFYISFGLGANYFEFR
jgi:hypothetical protein